MNYISKDKLASYIWNRTGIAFAITVVFYIIEFASNSLPFSFINLSHLHDLTPSLWIADLLPILTGVFSYIKGIENLNKDKELVAESVKHVEKSKQVVDFAKKLSEGEVNTEYNLTSDDELGKLLVNLRDSLIKKIEDEKIRKKEDDQRNWANHGLAKFGEILRKNTDDIKELSYDIISNLIRYMEANQGGTFIINDTDKKHRYFELTATYAYERRKYQEKTIEWGEGLIGACALEHDTIYMTEIPDKYTHITSGLGDATPNELLLVPLKLNDEIFGVIEIASFRKIEKYQIEFVEKVCESIASTISSVKVNIQTKKLLQESQIQAEELAQKDEEMRQNMEELMATQEEAKRQEEKMAGFVNAVNHTLIQAEFATSGTLLYANTKFINVMSYKSGSEIEGLHITEFIDKKDRKWFNEMWAPLSKGGKHFEGDLKHITKTGKELWLYATYTCMRSRDGEVEKVLFIGNDITIQKSKNLDFEGQVKAVNLSNIKAEFTLEGASVECNNMFSDTLGFSLEEFQQLKIFDFIRKDYQREFKPLWVDALKGSPFKGRVPFNAKTGEEKWLQITMSAAVDMYGTIIKVILLATDVTEQRRMEIEAHQQAEILKTQEVELLQKTELLRTSEENLHKKLEEARAEMKLQIVEIEKEKQKNIGILEGAVDGVVTFNQLGKIEFFNKAAEVIWKIDRIDVLGKNISDLITLEIEETEGSFTAYYIKGDDRKLIDIRSEITIINKDNEPTDVLVSISTIKLGNEHLFSAFIQNIEIELF